MKGMNTDRYFRFETTFLDRVIIEYFACGEVASVMAFDDRKTEPLLVVGGLSVICALIAPVVDDWFGWWWYLLLIVPPIVMWFILEWVWRGDDHRK